MKKFTTIFLEEAFTFLQSIDDKTREKIIYNIDKSSVVNDPKLFKKLKGEIWEFRTNFNQKQYRLLAFWDKEDKQETLVVATHGIVKKTQKMPEKEMDKAERIRQQYFDEK